MKRIMSGIIIGMALTFTATAFADSVEKFVLTKVGYPLVVEGKEYKSADLPVLNYNGNTYVPLKAVGDVLGADVIWNKNLHRVEIESANSKADGSSIVPSSDQKANNSAPTQGDNASTSSQLEIMHGYLPNASSPAIKLHGVVYLPVLAGSEKYQLTTTWVESSGSIRFERSNLQVKIVDDLSANTDSFIYQGTTYIKESFFIQASNLEKAVVEQIKSTLDQSFSSFKSMFPVDIKKLTEDNIVLTDAKHKANLSINEFFSWWNGLGDKRKQYTEEYAMELQRLNPNHPIQLRIFYSGSVVHMVSEVIVNVNGEVSHSSVREIANPNPDQSVIK